VNSLICKRNIRSASVIAAAMFLIFCGLSLVHAQGPAVVTVNPETTIEGDRVTLGRISSISGNTAVTERLSKVSLGYAPNIGMTREIRREQILLAIKAAGFSESDVNLESPSVALVRRPGQIISETLIRKAIENTFLPRLQAENVNARLTRLSIPPNIQVPIGKIDLRVNSSSVRNIFMPFSLPVEVRVNGSLMRTFPVTCEIEAYADIFRAVKDLPVGAGIAVNDLRRENTRIDRPVANYVRDLSALRGAALIRGVWSGSALTRDSIAAVAVIKPGDPIRIETGSGKMKIIVNGEAKAAGRIGDRISVKNSQTGTILQAFVVDKGVVKIAL
jgi:flagellar basal body P-ring formation protein FlgA